MKTTKQIKKIALAAMCMLLAAVTFADENQADSYIDTSSKQSADSYGSETVTPSKNDNVKITRKDGEILVDADPVNLGNGSVFMYNLSGFDVNQENAIYQYYPDLAEAGFRVNGFTGKMLISFNRAARSVVRQAFEQYEQEFSNKSLKIKNNKTYKEYGEVKSHLQWGLIGASNEAFPKTSVGYVFVKNSPYFTLTLWPARTKAPVQEMADDEVRSAKTTILFNKAQARAFVQAMNEDEIQKIVDSFHAQKQNADKY